MTTAPPVDRVDETADQPRRRRLRPVLATLLVVAVAAGGGVLWTASGGSVGRAAPGPGAPVLLVDGLDDGALLSAAAVGEVTVRAVAAARWADSFRVLLDGEPVATDGASAVLDGATLAALADGPHTIEVSVGSGGDAVVRTITFHLDATPPTVALPATIEADGYDVPLEVPLEVSGAAQVTVDGGEVELADDGTAWALFASPPSSVAVTAVDEAGNVASAELPVVVRFPGGRAVHTTPSAWRYAPKREPIIAMLEAGLIDAVQMDIKDELGDVSWDTDVAWADLSGAEEFNRQFDMRAAIETIHAHDARVIGRLTVYRDHRLAQWAWENGRADLVVQGTDGQPYAGRYGEYAFTNFAHPEVQQYNLDIALEAAELGFDDILYDYIRRPDGAIEKLVVPGLGERTPEEAVVELMATAYPLLRERGVWVGASVFGIAVDRPTQMAQDISLMAPHVDYIAPMVYPNHWNLGEYGVPVPEDDPYEIVHRSLTLYREALAGTGTVVMPWLQDFGGYGEAEVRAQIDATEDVTGQRWFLLWASSATYTDAALDPLPGRAALVP